MHQVVTEPAGDYDVAVLGGGFAGAAASRHLTQAGLRVIVIEARDRLGGRMWSEFDVHDGHTVEWGGAFMIDRPTYPLTWHEIDEAQLALEWGNTQPTQLIWLSEGERRTGPVPVPLNELPSLERLLVRLNDLAGRIDTSRPVESQDLSELDVPWPKLLEDLDLGPHTRDLWRSHIVTLAGHPWDVPSALPLLHSIASAGSVAGASFFSAPYDTPMARTLGPQLARGTGSLYDAIMSNSSADVLLGATVHAVDDGPDAATVTTSRGTVTARMVLCSLPISVLSSVRFTPGVAPELTTLAEQGVSGQAEKATVFVSNCPEPFYGHGLTPGGGFATASTTWHEGDRAIVVGFTAAAGALDLDDAAAVQASLRHYVPGIVVEKVAWHDWTNDPFSGGTWSYVRPGQTRLRQAARQPRGRLTFAGSDFDARLGVEGALYTAGLAAGEVINLLDRQT
ncbi:flavin monoamine oxidase family protein [soil metagenome]